MKQKRRIEITLVTSTNKKVDNNKICTYKKYTWKTTNNGIDEDSGEEKI